MVDLQTQHTFPPVVPCTVSAWGLPGKRRMSEPRGASASCQRSLSPHFAQTSVDCSEPAEGHWGERLKADKSAPTCGKNMLQTYSSVTLNHLSRSKGDNAELININAAMLGFFGGGFVCFVFLQQVGIISCCTCSHSLNFLLNNRCIND